MQITFFQSHTLLLLKKAVNRHIIFNILVFETVSKRFAETYFNYGLLYCCLKKLLWTYAI